MEKYTIGQLARAAAVPASTVRYYERRGLVEPTGRSAGNYRVYDQGALDRLRFVRSAQGAGFTLGDIAELLELKGDQQAPCDEVQGLISARLGEVVEQAEHLRRVEAMLGQWLKACRGAQRSGKCAVLVGLESSNEKKCTKSSKCP